MQATAEPLESPVLSDDYALDPYATITHLRATDPVHFVPGLGFWLVTRYDDVRRLFTDENVTNDPRAYEHYVAPPEGSFMHWVSEHGLFSLPPDEHARVRRLVSAAFTPRAIARMDSQVLDVIEQFVAPVRGRRGVVDLMAEITDPIPNAVISRVTGVAAPGGEEVRFRQLAQETIRGFFSFADPEARMRGADAFLELANWVREVAKERRRAPREDLITDLVRATDRGEAMSDDEIVILVAGLLGAGSETTAIGGVVSLRALLEHPDALARLRADRSLIPGAVNEILRHGFGGGAGLPRYAVRDFALRGKPIRKGQMLMLSFTGAHRDPSVFPDPDRFDIARDTTDLTIFGHGPHYCLGVHLALAELRGVVDAALDFLPPGARLRDDLIEWQRMIFFRRPLNLPVDFGG
ncbi:MAG TPA: cytochrome P450 [Candidatus Binatia bacterium]|nr:cytochrome P450 [Candidatus Binatia bacterium]